MGQVLCGYIDKDGHHYDHESFGDEGLSKIPSTSPSFKPNRSSRPSKAKKLSELNPRERARAAIIGGFVADAATMPLHLIYDQMGLNMLLDGSSNNHNNLTGGDCSASVAGSLSTNSTRSKASSRVSQQSSNATTTATDNEVVNIRPASAVSSTENRCSSPSSFSSPTSKLRTEPEFFPQPSSPFYSYAVGRQSPYGDEAHTFLRMISTRGYFDPDECCEEAFRFLRAYMERGGGRTNAVLRTFVERRESGLEWAQCSHASDAQFFCITKVPILVARYAGSPQMLARVEEGVRMFQTNDTVLSACRLSARLLERVIMGHSVLDTLRWATSSSTNDSSNSSSSSSSNSNQSTDPATSGTATGPGQGPGPDLSAGERAFLRVLEGMDGFMGLTGTRARASTAPSSSSSSHTVDGDGGNDDDADECTSVDEEEETEAVHAIITNGDSNLIFATTARPAEEEERQPTPAPPDAATAPTNTADTTSCSVSNDDAVEQSQSPSQSVPSSSSSVGSSPSKLSRLRMAAARAGTSASSCGDDGRDDDDDNDVKRLPVPPPAATAPVSSAPTDNNDPVVAVASSSSSSSSRNRKRNKGDASSSSSSSGAPCVPFSVAAEALGLGPRLPGSLQASLVALVCFPSYKAAVRANIVAGGDNALRAWLIGSLLAAEQGVEAIPSEWIERTLLYPQIEIMATRLAGSNPYFETLHEKGCRIGVLLA